MNLNNLCQIQDKLDTKIRTEKGLEGQDLLDKKILALQVELGELANEWRGFKFWSKDQEARTYVGNPNDICEECNGIPVFYEDDKIAGFCGNCDGCGVHFHNPLLEEYVDCLHFILSIGLEIRVPDEWVVDEIVKEITEKEISIEEQFIAFNQHLKTSVGAHDWFDILGLFIGLGEMLGFTTEQIEQAYLDKNKINHARQENGY